MLVSELKPWELARFCRVAFDEDDYNSLDSADKADFQRILPLAVAYCAGYAGLDTSQELPDEIGYAIFVVAAEMYDNRQMTQQYSAQNATVKQILDMHSTNLLPSVEGDV